VLNNTESNTKIMIPINNADTLIRKVITKKEIERIASKISNLNIEIIDDFKIRMKTYDELLKSRDVEKLFLLLKMIYIQNNERDRISMAEREIGKKAEKILYDECAYSLQIPKDNVEEYLFENLNNKNLTMSEK
jgi:RNA polymerase-interacting CarD/CdnL/TRCF family regulator